MSSSRRRSAWRVGALGAVLAGVVGLSGCWDGPGAGPVSGPDAPPRRDAASVGAPVDPPVGAPDDVAGEESPARAVVDDRRAPAEADVVGDVLRGAPLAPSFYALALGLEVDATTRVDVSVDGAATLYEVDLAEGPVPLRRARAVEGGGTPGLFGRGWRSEVETRVVAVGEGALVVRVQGVTPFVPLEAAGDVDDEVTDVVLVSLAGEVELLRRTAGGWELAAADGRVFAFDADGRLAALTPGFTVERAPGRVTLVGDEGGRVVLTLDAASGRATRAASDDASVAFAHDAAGELVAAGARRYEVDAQGRLARAGALALEHDPAGRLARLVCADGRAQVYAFADGRAEVTTAAGTFAYERVDDGFVVRTPRGEDRAWLDARGRLVALRRAGEATQVFERDALEQPLPTGADDEDQADVGDDAAQALGLRVERDDAGRLREVLTPAGRRWSFGWDEGRLVTTDGPAGPVALGRDARGQTTSRRDASGRELFFERDAQGEVVSVATRAGEQVVWTRDDAGRVVGLEAHDAAGRSSRLGWLLDEVTGAVIAVELPGGETLVYGQAPGHDEVLTPWGLFAARDGEAGLPAELETPAGTFRFEHDAQGRRVATTYPNGLVVERARDEAGRVVRQVARRAGRVVSQVESAWDARGDRASTTRDGAVTRYRHDARGRLAGLTRGEASSAWTWNDDGDRTGEARDGVAREVRHDSRGRLVSRAGGGQVERFVHDGAGRLVERVVESSQGEVLGRDRFEHDGFGRLVRVARAGRPAVDYTYDPLGRVATRTVDGETTRLVHDGERLLAELGPGTRERLYVWGPADDEPLAWGERAGRDAPWSWRYVVSSDLHTSLAHVDALGRVVGTDDLDPWGAAGASGVASDRPVFFAGHRVDALAGLVPMRARWYDPSLGRFVTPDPAGLAAGPNAYAYVSGRPLDLVDPLGLQETGRDEPGLLGRFGRWVGDKAAATKDTFVGAAEGAAYLLGLRGTASERAAARAASWDDLASGRAQSRALGATDAYVQGLTFGLVDPNTSRFAHDPEQARRGRAYGDAGALAYGLISGRAALTQGVRQGASGLVSGVRALPDAVRALPGLVRAAPGATGRGLAAVGRGLRAAPGQGLRALRAAPGQGLRALRATPGLVRDGLAWLARSRDPLARAVGRVVREQAAGAYRVTVGPFVNLGRALLHPVRTAQEVGRGLARLPRALRDVLRTGRSARRAGAPSSPVGALTLGDDAVGLARSADDLPRHTVDDLIAASPDDAARAARAADDAAAQAAQAPSRGPQDGIVQALGDGPPTGAATGAPSSPAGALTLGDEAVDAARSADDLSRLTADDLIDASLDDATRAAGAADDAGAQAGQAASRGGDDPRPGQGRTQTPRAPPANRSRVLETDRLEIVEEEANRMGAYHRERGSKVGGGDLVDDGDLYLDIDVVEAGLPKRDGYGSETIWGIRDAFEGTGRRVNAIVGNWVAVGPRRDNFVAFAKNLRAGMSVVEAARATPTGAAAAILGFHRVLPGPYTPIHNGAGKIVGISFRFVRG